MEVLVGPTFTMEPAAAVPPPRGLFFAATDHEEEKENSFSSISSSSSIGAPDDDEEEDDAVSSKCVGSLGSFDSLEDSLPIKRGLSNYFSGKSKSFANLSEVTRAAATEAGSVKKIEKAENPFNKRRRIFIANRWASASRKSSFYALQDNNPTSMPLLTLHEDDDREPLDDNDDRRHRLASSSSDDPEQDQWGPPPRFNQERRSPLFSRSCISLADLQ